MKNGIEWNGPAFSKEIEMEASNRMLRTCVLISNEAVRSMARPKSGAVRARKRLKSGRISKSQKSRWQKTRRSAPGEPPAVQTGKLWRSLGFMAGGIQKLSTLRWRLGTHEEPAKFLEPTKDAPAPKTRMRPRPFLEPAMKKMKPKIERLFSREKL